MMAVLRRCSGLLCEPGVVLATRALPRHCIAEIDHVVAGLACDRRGRASEAAGVAMMRYSAVAKAGSSGLGVSFSSATRGRIDRRRTTSPASPSAGGESQDAAGSASVVASGTVGPEPMVAGSFARHAEDGERSACGRRAFLSRPALLDACEKMPPAGVHLMDVGAALEQPARQRRF